MSRLKCLEKHECDETCLRTTEVLILNIKGSNRKQMEAIKLKPSPGTMNPTQGLGNLV